MKLKQKGKSGTNGMDYFDLCTDNFKFQFGYIAKKNDFWKLYIMVNGDKKYFIGSFSECIKKAEFFSGKTF